MATSISAWWDDVRMHVDSYDNADWTEWRWGAMCEGHLEEMQRKGLEPNGHGTDRPDWLRRQQHFENFIAVLVERARWALGALWCRTFGHPDRCVDVQEGDAESPWVAWSCSCCGNGGHSWW
jgi:hypothetical protein